MPGAVAILLTRGVQPSIVTPLSPPWECRQAKRVHLTLEAPLRFGIESMFRDLKTGSYPIEHTYVSESRFLALVWLVAMADTWTALQGLALRSQPELALYLSRRPPSTPGCTILTSRSVSMASFSSLAYQIVALWRPNCGRSRPTSGAFVSVVFAFQPL